MNRTRDLNQRPAGAFCSFVAIWAALACGVVFFLSGVPAAAQNIFPVRPSFEGQKVAILPVRNGCTRLAKFMGPTAADTGGLANATAIVLALASENPVLRRTYPSLEALRVAAEKSEKPCPSENGRVYVYAPIGNGQVVRTYAAVHNQCFLIDADVFCTEPVPRPDTIVVKFSEETTPQQVQRFIRGLDLKTHHTIRPFPDVGQTLYVFSLPQRHLKSWIRIFLATPFIDEVSREVLITAGLHSTIQLEAMELEKQLGAPLSTRQIAVQPSDTKKRLSAFLLQRYNAKGVVSPLKDVGDYLSVRISGLRGEVIKGETFWEMLTANFVIPGYPSFDGQTRLIHVFMDGKYATGIGPREPTADGYDDMERKYYRPLREYTDALTTEAQTFLGRP